MSDEQPIDVSGRQLVFLAAERTLLAWMRTALAVMTLGFVIERFGIFLQRTAPEAELELLPRELTFWAGLSLVVLGVAMQLAATFRYWRFSVHFHEQGRTDPGRGLAWVIGFSIAIAVCGLVIAGFLLAS